MKKVLNYFKLHTVEVLYAFISALLLVAAIVLNSWLPILAIVALYVLSILLDLIVFLLSKKPLYIETPDGYNEPYHPSVVYFKDGWNGYKYWMAFTPMPKKGAKNPYTDRWECPCVYASNDGISFKSPDGKKGKFLDDLTDEEIANRDYFSDTHLVYNEANDTLEVYYRLTNRCESAPNGEKLWLLRRTSKDGIYWSSREELLCSANGPDVGPIYISPAIILQDNEYTMWYVSSYNDNRSMHVAKTKDMKSFYDISKCVFEGRQCDPWHIDCHKIGGVDYLLVYEFTNELTIWTSTDGIHFNFKKVLLKATNKPGVFYHALYRSCITENHMGEYSLYFSAQNSKEIGFGIASGKTIDAFKIINGNGIKKYKIFCFDILSKYLYFATKFILKFRIK